MTIKLIKSKIKKGKEKKRGDKMGIISIRCPKCGTTRTVTPSTGFVCRGCGARISVGPDGKIRSLVPKGK